MAIDIQGLNDTLLKTSKNYDEAVRKWVDLALAPAKDVPIEYYDQNGNLVQVAIPNRAKLFNDLLVNVNSAMSRTYYVDAVNGDDLNDGSQTSPFKTIKKAIDSVPVEGVGVIILEPGQIYTIDSHINIGNKNITITTSDGNNKPTIKFTEYVTSANDRALYTFILQGVLTFLYVDIVLPNVSNTSLGKNSRYATAILPLYGSRTREPKLNIYWSTITLDGDYSFVDMTSAGAGSPAFSMDTYGAGVVVNTIFSKLVVLKELGLLRLNLSIIDNTGTGLTVNDLIAGIIKDANGTPRNVVSNLIL